MKKKKLFPLILIHFLLLTGCAGGLDTNMDTPASEPPSRETQIMPSEISPPDICTPETVTPDIDTTIEHSFLGTVIEETDSYMIVEPDEYEEERQLSDRFTVRYPSEHPDYLYGEGRRVVVYYFETPSLRSDFEMITDDISTEGFRDFDLSIIPSEHPDSLEKVMICEGLYYYGISDITISVDNQTLSLPEALESDKITLRALLVRANQDVRNGIAKELSYDDGGSALYQYEDYSIIKYHTLDGNRDMYIGSRDMDIRVCLPGM